MEKGGLSLLRKFNAEIKTSRNVLQHSKNRELTIFSVRRVIKKVV